MSPKLFRANIPVLAERVQSEARERHTEAETAYQIRGSNNAMEVDFMIRADHGQDNITITYRQGVVDFDIIQQF